MEYREFVCAAIETMNQKEGKNGIQAREHRAVKNNGKIRVGLLLQETGSNLFPTIYLEEYYEKFQKGETLEQIVSEISQLYQKIKAKNIIDVDSFFNLESWKNKLGIKVIKTEKNRELLEEIPHLDVLDLSLTFYVILDRQCEGSATMQITNEYMRQWNLETEELYEMAMRSAVRLLPTEFCSLPDMIRRITGIEVEAIRGMQRECQMYVLTNSSKIQGAACMFYPIVFILVIAALVQFVEMFLKKAMPPLYQALGVYLPLITTNCAVLGVALTNVQKSYSIGAGVVNGVATAVGFLIAIVLMAGIREKIEYNDVLESFQGTPIVLVTAGLMAIAFFGFSGLI